MTQCCMKCGHLCHRVYHAQKPRVMKYSLQQQNTEKQWGAGCPASQVQKSAAWQDEKFGPLTSSAAIQDME